MKFKSILGGGLDEAAAVPCAECARLRQQVKDEIAFLIKQADGLERNIDAYVFGAPMSKRGWRRTLARTRDLRRMLDQVLARLKELQVKRIDVTERVDLLRHTIQVPLNSPRAEDDGRLCSVYVHGYETLDGEVIRPAVVSAMRYLPPITPGKAKQKGVENNE